MVKYNWVLCLTAIAVISACSVVSAGTYSGGDGSAEFPYLIATADDMQAIVADPNNWDKHFLLTNDINLSAYTGTMYNIIAQTGSFTSVFD